MSNPLRRVRPGEPLKVAHQAWNRIIDEVVPRQSDIARQEAFPRPNFTLRCRNFTTGPLYPGDVLQVDSLLEVPTGVTGAAETTFWSWPGVVGMQPGLSNATTISYAVMVEPVPALGIGQAAIAGVVQSRVVRRCTGHQYARPVTGVTSHFESADSGPFRILAIAPTGPVPTGATGPGAPAALLLFGTERAPERIPSYATGATQLLGHPPQSGATGCDGGLQWFSVTECSGTPSYASSYFL